MGVNEKRAHEWGVPVGKLVMKGELIPGSSTRAKLTGYYCPRSVWRPPSGECLMVDNSGHTGGPAAHYSLHVLRETGTGESGFAGRLGSFSLSGMKAYLCGVADGAPYGEENLKGRR